MRANRSGRRQACHCEGQSRWNRRKRKKEKGKEEEKGMPERSPAAQERRSEGSGTKVKEEVLACQKEGREEGTEASAGEEEEMEEPQSPGESERVQRRGPCWEPLLTMEAATSLADEKLKEKGCYPRESPVQLEKEEEENSTHVKEEEWNIERNQASL